MKKVLIDGKDKIYCISTLEAEMLNLHIDGNLLMDNIP